MVTDILENGHDDVFTVAARIPILIASLIENTPPGNASASAADLIHRAQRYIGEHAVESVDFEALAESLGLTYRAFRYLFTKETARSPLQYQLEIRLARAKNLLSSSDMPITEIAKSLGFRSAWYFSHFFRKHAKTSAMSYRQNSAEFFFHTSDSPST